MFTRDTERTVRSRIAELIRQTCAKPIQSYSRNGDIVRERIRPNPRDTDRTVYSRPRRQSIALKSTHTTISKHRYDYDPEYTKSRYDPVHSYASAYDPMTTNNAHLESRFKSYKDRYEMAYLVIIPYPTNLPDESFLLQSADDSPIVPTNNTLTKSLSIISSTPVSAIHARIFPGTEPKEPFNHMQCLLQTTIDAMSVPSKPTTVCVMDPRVEWTNNSLFTLWREHILLHDIVLVQLHSPTFETPLVVAASAPFTIAKEHNLLDSSNVTLLQKTFDTMLIHLNVTDDLSISDDSDKIIATCNELDPPTFISTDKLTHGTIVSKHCPDHITTWLNIVLSK